MKREGEKLIFSTGREVVTHKGIVGLQPPDISYNGEWGITEGCDGGISLAGDDFGGEGLRPEEQVELAEYMIEQWTAFRHTAADIIDQRQYT